MEICPKCGLPKEACVCEIIAKTEQKIKVTPVKKRYGKISTVISGIDPKGVDFPIRRRYVMVFPSGGSPEFGIRRAEEAEHRGGERPGDVERPGVV